MRRSLIHPQGIESQTKQNQFLGWESNPDRQICALMLCLLSYRDPHLKHIIQPRFHITADSVITATSPTVAMQARHGYPRQTLPKR